MKDTGSRESKSVAIRVVSDRHAFPLTAAPVALASSAVLADTVRVSFGVSRSDYKDSYRERYRDDFRDGEKRVP